MKLIVEIYFREMIQERGLLFLKFLDCQNKAIKIREMLGVLMSEGSVYQDER